MSLVAVASPRLPDLLPRPRAPVPEGQISPSAYLTLNAAFERVMQTFSPGLRIEQKLPMVVT